MFANIIDCQITANGAYDSALPINYCPLHWSTCMVARVGKFELSGQLLILNYKTSAHIMLIVDICKWVVIIVPAVVVIEPIIVVPACQQKWLFATMLNNHTVRKQWQ